MDNLLQQGITAVKAGNREQAFKLLTRATQDAATAEQAWLWLSAVVESDPERLFCLDNALRLNPRNEPAQRGATTLRQKGIFPAPPMPPQDPNSAVKGISSQASAAQSPAPSSLQVDRQTPAATPIEEKDRQEMTAFYRFAAIELANNKLPPVVVKLLVDRGVTPAIASRIVSETQQAFKNARAEKYRKRMIRGLIWTAAGIVLTCGSYVFASSQGGQYVLCYGAIIFGFIDFLVGLVGWLSSK